MSDKEIFDWIQQEITATRITKVQKVVGYEEHLEPNPELGVCEGTFQPTTRDRQHVIVYEAIYDMVDETVLDEKRAATAAQVLTELVLKDETLIGRARRLMSDESVFIPFWEQIYSVAQTKKARRIAAYKLGRSPIDVIAAIVGTVGEKLYNPVRIVWYTVTGILFYVWVIYFFWPQSNIGLIIADMAQSLVTYIKNLLY